MLKRMLLFIVLPITLIAFVTSCSNQPTDGQASNHEEKQNNEEGKKNEEIPKEDKQAIYWGIDTASVLEDERLACVRENFGDPSFIGRYIGDKEEVSFGLTQEEIDFIHGEELKILLIFNHFTEGVSYDVGVEEANEAISLAEDLGVPEGEYIFADVEPSYPVDSAFILGWTETMLDSPYKPGLYGVFSEQSDNNLLEEYTSFKEENKELSEELALWVSEVNVGITNKDDAPTEFNPDVPDGIEADAWQYGIDSENCNIDTNLIQSQTFDELW